MDTIARSVEERLGHAMLLTPTLWLGSSHHHRDFPGTISARPSVYTAMLTDVALSILRTGFKKIFFLNGHGGNETPASQALSELVATNDEADAASLAFASWWRVGTAALDPTALGMATPGIGHACEYETSLMLFLHPSLVQQTEATDAPPLVPDAASPPRVTVFHRFHRLTASGGLGAPTRATADKGEAMFTGLVDAITNAIEEFARWPEPVMLGPKAP